MDSHLLSKGHIKKSAPPKPPITEKRALAKAKKLPPTFVGPRASLRYGARGKHTQRRCCYRTMWQLALLFTMLPVALSALLQVAK